MKIIHVITAFGIGGAEKLLLNIINKQIEKYQVFLIYFKDKDDLIKELNPKVIVSQIKLNKSINSNLKNAFKRIEPDIIHTHLGHADFFGLWASKSFKAKKFCTMHNIYFKKNYLDIIFFKIYRFLFNNYLKDCQVISISKSVKNHVEDKLKVNSTNSHLIYNAIPKKYLKKIKQSEQLNIVFVGRLEKQKSISTLLKSIYVIKKNKPDLFFNVEIIGDGTLRKELENLNYNLKIDDYVQFRGEQKKVDVFYSKADIFILPSIWEGFGIVILEAFRAKVAVIASNIEGPSELIKDNVNGLLFEPANEVELAEKLLLLINNAKKRKELAENGYNSFTEKYTIDSYVNSLNNLYEDN